MIPCIISVQVAVVVIVLVVFLRDVLVCVSHLIQCNPMSNCTVVVAMTVLKLVVLE